MNSNIFLAMFGLNPDEFELSNDGPIDYEDGYIVDLIQKVTKDKRVCPRCGSTKCYSNGKYPANYEDFAPNGKKYVFNITRKRLRCEGCGKAFSPSLTGITPYSVLTQNITNKIIECFKEKKTFADIAYDYHVTTSYVIKLFDEEYKYVPRGDIPEVLCIDEFYFSRKADFKYCCCLVDFMNRELIDVIQSRQKPFLEEYFDNVPFAHRQKVRYFVSDMYDGYAYIKNKYFPKAIHIIDLFHVVSLLTNAVNTIRCQVLKQRGIEDYLNRFMKLHWEYFLCRYEKIPDKWYAPKDQDGVVYHYDDMVSECIKLDDNLWTGYNILQDLLHYKWYGNYEDSLKFIEMISKRLIDTGNEYLEKVGRSYHNWRYEIASGFTKNEYKIHISNGIAECINNNIKTIIKLAYGYRIFERFRKRCMIMYYYSK